MENLFGVIAIFFLLEEWDLKKMQIAEENAEFVSRKFLEESVNYELI